MSDPESVGDNEPAVSATAASKPVLASEALMEDVAPQEPWRAGARWWSILGGLLVAATAFSNVFGESGPTDAAIAPLAVGGVALLAGLVPLPYVLRGVLMLLAGLALVGLAAGELGPLGGLQAAEPWWPVHAATVFTLPAALMFRDRYRLLARARYFLGFSLVVSLGFVAFCVVTITRSGMAAQIASGIGVVAVVLSLLGFMASHAPMAGSLLAAIVTGAVTGQLTTVVVGDGFTAAALQLAGGFLGLAMLGGLGVAQCMAAASYAHARSMDFRRDNRDNTERPPMPSLTSDSWSGRR